MLTDFSFLACGSPFKEGEVALFFLGFISLALGALMALTNLVLLSVLGLRYRHPVAWHFVAWFTCIGLGVLLLLAGLTVLSLATIAGSMLTLAILVAVHLSSLVYILRQARKSAVPQ